MIRRIAAAVAIAVLGAGPIVIADASPASAQHDTGWDCPGC